MKTRKRKAGRPIAFDREAALEAAMLLFWERGYEGASMADLTRAMGLSASSIYAAFGDKQALFSAAAKRYMESRAGFAMKALEEPTLERVIRALFENTARFLTAPGHPPTCMTLTGAMGCGAEANSARELMREIRRQNQSVIRRRVLDAQKKGELPKGVRAEDYARYVATVLAGLSIQAANGATREELETMGRMAVRYLGF